MNHRKPFSKAGDIIGKWRFERKLTYEEKVAHYQERASSDADNQTSKSMIRREWVAATCLACSCEQYVRADHVRCGNSSQCHACRRAAQANPYCHPEHRWYPIYTRLNNAQQRCCNAENPAHKDYGQRGVRIHARYCIAAQTVMHGSGRVISTNFSWIASKMTTTPPFQARWITDPAMSDGLTAKPSRETAATRSR
jgi:hypothetical protein